MDLDVNLNHNQLIFKRILFSTAITFLSLNQQAWESDVSVESWREALETQFTEYAANHYKHGVCAVFGQSRNDSISLVACIEDHQFQPKNYWYNSLLLPFFAVYFCGISILRIVLQEWTLEISVVCNSQWWYWRASRNPQSAGFQSLSLQIIILVVLIIFLQVHYYEDGNVQLVCSKNVKHSVTSTVRRNHSKK